MTTEHTTDQHEEAEKDSPIRYVEELADKDDYWLSLTDVARVTRTSDSMVRRWVTSGRLPCKKEGVGINQRTRMVRASDVRKIREIIDPGAAITDDIRKMDLASIPRQQEQIMKQQEQIIQDHQNLNTLLQKMLTETVHAQIATQTALDMLTRQHAILQQDYQALLKRLIEAELETAHQAARIDTTIVEIQASLSTVASHQNEQQQQLTAQTEQIQAVEHNVDQAAENVAMQIHQVETDLHAQLDGLDSRLNYQVAGLGHVEAALRTIQSNQDDQQHQLATLEQDQARDVADLHRQVESTSKEIALKINEQAMASSAIRATIIEVQQHANSQELQLNALRRELEAEVQARKTTDEKAPKKQGRKPAQGV